MTTKNRAAAIAATTALVAGTAVAVAVAPSDAVKGTPSAAPSVTEGKLATATITLKNPAKKTLKVNWKTLPGTAKGKDFTKVNAGHLVFSKGQLAATVAVPTTDDAKVEQTEYFYVKFSARGVKLTKKKVKIAIADNDGATTSPSATASSTASQTATATATPTPAGP